MCDHVRPLTEETGAGDGETASHSAPTIPGRGKLYLRLPSASDPRWPYIQKILIMVPGAEPLRAKFTDTGECSAPLPCQIHPILLQELREQLGEENVVVKGGAQG